MTLVHHAATPLKHATQVVTQVDLVSLYHWILTSNCHSYSVAVAVADVVVSVVAVALAAAVTVVDMLLQLVADAIADAIQVAVADAYLACSNVVDF